MLAGAVAFGIAEDLDTDPTVPIDLVLQTNGSIPVLEVDPGFLGVPGSLDIKLITPADVTVLRRRVVVNDPSGGEKTTLPLPELCARENDIADDLMWSRLVLVWSPAEGTTREWTELVASVAPEAAIARLILTPPVGDRDPWIVDVTARHPLSGDPVAGAVVELQMLDPEDRPAGETIRVVTDQRGNAFTTVPAISTSGIGVTLVTTTRSGPFRWTTESELWDAPRLALALATDRPLYRPGETVQFRAVALEHGRRVLARDSAVWTLENPHGQVVLRLEEETSRFGVTAGEWQIPTAASHGEYELELSVNGEHESISDQLEIQVAPFELPDIAVRVVHPAGYVLPGQDAEVEVAARTASGRSVVGAQVATIARELDWCWWSDDDEGEFEETEVLATAQTDDHGLARLEVGLNDAIDRLDEWGWSQFEDTPLVARVVDPATTRAVYQPFELRASRHPVHIYLVGTDDNAIGLPYEAAITTYRADGKPLPCTVNLFLVDAGQSEEPPREPHATVTTDRFGVAQAWIANLPSDDDEDLEWRLRADCGNGLEGEAAAWFSALEEAALRIRPEHAILEPGETIAARLTSTESVARVEVLVRSRDAILGRYPVALRDGQASLDIPVSPEIRGPVYLTARLGTDWASDSYWIGGRAAVLYPQDPPMSATATAPAVARPGEHVPVRIRLTDIAADTAPSVAGLAVTDERIETVVAQRSDSFLKATFAEQSRRSLGWRYSGESFAGITASDISSLATAPERARYESVARMILDWDTAFGSEVGFDLAAELEDHYKSALDRMAAPITKALAPCPTEQATCPTSPAELEQRLEDAGLVRGLPMDPWNRPVHVRMTAGRTKWQLVVSSDGPDHLPDTSDDVSAPSQQWDWPSQLPPITNLPSDILRSHEATGGWPTTRSEILGLSTEAGHPWAASPDPWGRPLEVVPKVAGRRLAVTVEVRPLPPDARFPEWRPAGGWTAATVTVDTFAAVATRIEKALIRKVGACPHAVSGESPVETILAEAGVTEDERLDLDGRPLRFLSDETTSWSDTTIISPSGSKMVPGTSTVTTILVHAVGEDGLPATSDDILVARIGGKATALARRLAAEEADAELAAALADDPERGALIALIVDDTGVPVPGVTVTLQGDTHVAPQLVAVSDGTGRVAVACPADTYSVTARFAGFEATTLTGVTVQIGQLTRVSLVVTFEGDGQEIEVSAEAPVMETTSLSIGDIYTIDGVDSTVAATFGTGLMNFDEIESSRGTPGLPSNTPLATPRLRRDFALTTFWAPELELGPDGRLEVDVPLTDSVTTWRVQAVVTTLDGRLATADTEIAARLPLVVQLPVPQRLTVGDHLELPVAVRNHLETTVRAKLGLASSSAAIRIVSEPVAIDVAPGLHGTATFDLRAEAPEPAVTLTATARSVETADAVEASVEVVPLARLERQVTAALIRDRGTLEPPTDPGGTPSATRLRILPDPGPIVRDAVEGMASRPGSCSEQLASTALANYLLAGVLESANPAGDGGNDAISAERGARDLLRSISRRATADGGLAYWEGGHADVALTAHVVRVAAEIYDDDTELPTWVDDAATWLANRIGERGLVEGAEAGGPQLAITAEVARALAEIDSDDPKLGRVAAAALDAIVARLDLVDEPQALATALLTAHALGQDDRVRALADRLLGLSTWEGQTAYWALHRNTPLSGWGLPGRIETTALVIQSLLAAGEPTDRLEVAGGLHFLMLHKGPLRSWFSTRATLAVLESLVAADLGGGHAGGRLEVRAGGEVIANIDLEPGAVTELELPAETLGAPLGLVRTGGDAWLQAELVVESLHPWDVAMPTSEHFQLEVEFDRTSTVVDESIHCRVNARRLGHRGYGMLLAEIGLPPGARVDRAGLERQLGDSFEIWPDRVVLYLWPRPEGTTIDFEFEPAFAGDLWSAPSSLEDYYNPEARIDLAPTRFRISRAPE
jgi:hypothetical protein